MAGNQAVQYSVVPLREWAKNEEASLREGPSDNNADAKNELVLKKAIISYGLAHLMKQMHKRNMPVANQQEKIRTMKLDNSLVRLVHENSTTSIAGIEMIEPRLSAKFFEPPFYRSLFADQKGPVGRYIKVEIDDVNEAVDPVGENDERSHCHLLGTLMHELFSGQNPFPTDGLQQLRISGVEESSSLTDGPTPKRNSGNNSSQSAIGGASLYATVDKSLYVPLLEFGVPSCLSKLVCGLLGCGGGISKDYDASLDGVCEDMHLVILQPSQFLFNRNTQLESNGKDSLQFKEGRLYGRESEENIINEAFNRVSGGTSEALFIGGASGSGKTRLVQSLTDSVKAVGWFVITEKFDLMEQEPFSTVISAFNALCCEMKRRLTPEQLQEIANNLLNEFVSDFQLLVQVLPRIGALFPQLGNKEPDHEALIQMDLHGISFILRRFMRVVSSKSHPVMLFLDDLQWANSTALEIIEHIFSDEKGSNCFFFVGSYRSNEVDSDHPIFDLANKVQSLGIQTIMLHLGGIPKKHLNLMISDALGIFPRTCESLSELVLLHTKGNPFFVQEYLKSLVDKKLLQYSLREQWWVWDADEIRTKTLTEDIIHLLSSKISLCCETMQSALKVASCFGVKMNKRVIDLLGETSFYQNLQDHLNLAVSEGFMSVSDGIYTFVHDKVWEAAYFLIPISERDLFHFNLATMLYSASDDGNRDDVLFQIVDQFQKGPLNLENENWKVLLQVTCPEMQIDVPELFYKAGLKAENQSDYPRARSYYIVAKALVPSDSWESHYDLFRRIFFHLAKASYCCGSMPEAKQAIQQILEKGKSFEDKKESYFLLISILCDCEDFEGAYSKCTEALTQLHHRVPTVVDFKDVAELMATTSEMVLRISDSDVLNMEEADERTQTTLKFYTQLFVVAFFFRPQILLFCACKMVRLTLEKGVCIFSALGLVQYSMLLCCNDAAQNIPMACRVGRLGMSLKKRFESLNQTPRIFTLYYGFVAAYCEPLQSCSEMLLRSFEIGNSTGDISFAFKSASVGIRAAFFSGANLPKLLERSDYFLKVSTEYKNVHSESYFSYFNLTIRVLLGNSSSNNPSHICGDNGGNDFILHLSLRSYWLGHHERFDKSFKKYKMPANNLSRDILWFLQGLNNFQYKRGKNNNKKLTIGRQLIKLLKPLAELSKWNYQGKVEMLEAELLSLQERAGKAEALYESAIESSRRSKFVHEEGLARELLGYHYTRCEDNDKALTSFAKAKDCYTTWGSHMKVKQIDRQIDQLQMKVAGKSSHKRS